MMKAERYVFVCILLVTSLLWGGCAPGLVGNPGMVASSSQGNSGADSSAGVVGNLTPTAISEQAGQTAPSAAQDSTPIAAPPNAAASSSETVMYMDAQYHFSISYPADFVLGNLSPEKLAALEPTPVAALTLMNPETAASNVVDLEPADLELRFFPAQQGQSLEEWLNAHALLPADKSVLPQPFQTESTSGLEVCTSSLIVPNCFYFFAGANWIYELIPMTQEGETIMGSFAITE